MRDSLPGLTSYKSQELDRGEAADKWLWLDRGGRGSQDGTHDR